MKKIRSLRLQRFRQFADTIVEVRDFNVLVGPNNCGKTTILHAIRAFFLLMHGHVRFEGNSPDAVYHKRYLTGAEEVAPTPDIKELWHQQRAGKPLTISLTFDDDTTFGVSLRQQFGQIHVSAENLPEGLTAASVASYLATEVAFIPGLVGVLVSEPYATAARRNALATQGRYSEIFRSSLHQLNSKDPTLLEQINTWLTGLFGVSVSAVEFDGDSDEYVTVKYKQGSSDFDVVSSGAGLQQVIQMLTYLYLKKPRILLIDEPDAHLHSKLQARLGDLFRRIATDLDAQVFLSTHSLDLIDTFSTNDVTVVDSSKKKLSPIGKNADLVSVLVDADVVDVSALSRLLSSRRLVVVEDKDQTILKSLDKACGSPLYSSKSSSYVLSARGVSNFRAVAELGKVLAGLTGTKFDITFVQDRDGMPDFIVPAFLASQQEEGVVPHLLERHEIENYLLEPELLVAAAALVGTTITAADATIAILAAAQELKAEARRASLECARGVNRFLRERRKEDELDVLVFKWFDELKLDDLNTVQRVFPGKELLPKVLQKISGGGKTITKGHCVAVITKELISADMTAFIEKAAENIEKTPSKSAPAQSA
ncbi:AAA family ATPase [Sorangium sp. So ce406]|uniref:AAA family ATPase n=1 Tax=Sorangium sp. So ce406 TaxID=3133311 RepID=UPI003F5B629A